MTFFLDTRGRMEEMVSSTNNKTDISYHVRIILRDRIIEIYRKHYKDKTLTVEQYKFLIDDYQLFKSLSVMTESYIDILMSEIKSWTII